MAKLLTHSHSFGRHVQSTRAPGGPPTHIVRASSLSCGEAALDSRRVLGVGPDASKREVKAAYRKLALQFHPDITKAEHSEVSFAEVNRAYESLIAALEADESPPCNGRDGADDEVDEEWADFVQSLVDGHPPREDFSSYYSNLKLYSKANSRKYQYYQGNW